MNISFIIPNYNGEGILQKNVPILLDVLKQYKHINFETIIVDDKSTDKSLEIIEDLIKKFEGKFDVKLLKSDTNKGFSSTVNYGVSEAKGELVFLLNTDVYPENDFLKNVLPHFEDPNIFAVACMDKSIEGSTSVLRGRGIGSWERGFLVHTKGKIDKTNTLWVSGGSSIFRKSIWVILGGMDELFNPFYYEDIDLSYRAIKSGYTILFEPKSVVVHEHEQGAIQSTYSPKHIKKIAYRNQIIFSWKNISDSQLVISHFIWMPYHILKATVRGDMAFLLGVIDAIKKNAQIIANRKEVQKLVKKTDKEVTNTFIDEI